MSQTSPHVQRSSSVFRNVKREVKAADTTIDEYGNRVEVSVNSDKRDGVRATFLQGKSLRTLAVRTAHTPSVSGTTRHGQQSQYLKYFTCCCRSASVFCHVTHSSHSANAEVWCTTVTLITSRHLLLLSHSLHAYAISNYRLKFAKMTSRM